MNKWKMKTTQTESTFQASEHHNPSYGSSDNDDSKIETEIKEEKLLTNDELKAVTPVALKSIFDHESVRASSRRNPVNKIISK